MAVQRSSLIRSTIANWLGTMAGLAVTLILAPFALRYLQEERFGIYGIARQLLGLLMILDLGILGAVNRLATRYVMVSDQDGVNRIVSVSFFMYAALSLVVVVVTAVGVIFGPAFFNIRPEFAADARGMFALVGATIVVTLMAFPWMGLVFSYSRFDLNNIGSATARLLTLGLVVVAFQCGWVSLSVAIGCITLPTLLQLVYVRWIARRLNPGLQIHRRYATREGIREVVGFSLWNLLYMGGNTILWSSDNLLIGRVLDPAQVPPYWLPFQLISIGQVLVVGMSAALTPMAAGMAATRSADELRSALVRSTRIALILALCANGIMVVMVRDFLPLWVHKSGYEGSWVIYAVLIGGFWAYLAATPVYNMLLGAGDIRGPAIGMVACGAVAIALKIVLTKGFGLGLVAVAWGTTVPLLLFSGVYMPWEASRMAGLSLWRLYRQAYLGPIACLLPVLAVGALGVHYFPPPNLLVWLVYFAILAMAYMGLCWPVLDAADRAKIGSLLKRFRPSMATVDEEVLPPDGSQ